MTRLRLKMEGRPKQISMDSFLKVMKEIPELLGELDCAVSRNRSGTLDWVISDLKTGSAYLEIESRVVRGNEDFAQQVAQHFTDGLIQITEGSNAASPPLFSTAINRRLMRIVRNLEATGSQGLIVSSPDIEREASLTRKAEPILRELISVRYKDIGAVEGRLEAVSLRPRRFDIHDSISRRVVKCDLPTELEKVVRDNLGETVEVFGLISFNAQAEPLSIDVESLRALGSPEVLPTIEDVLGIAPDFTGDLSTEEFIRVVRGG